MACVALLGTALHAESTLDHRAPEQPAPETPPPPPPAAPLQTIPRAQPASTVDVLKRQEKLVVGLRELNLPRTPLTQLLKEVQKNPRLSAKDFAANVDKTAKQFERDPSQRMTPGQQARLKQIYQEHLGNVPDAPGTQFLIAARMAGVVPPELFPTEEPGAAGSKINDPNAGFAGSSGPNSQQPLDMNTMGQLLQQAMAAQSKQLEQLVKGQLGQVEKALGEQKKSDGDGKRGSLEGLLAKLAKGDEKEGKGDDKEGGGSGKGKDSHAGNSAFNKGGDRDRDDDKRPERSESKSNNGNNNDDRRNRQPPINLNVDKGGDKNKEKDDSKKEGGRGGFGRDGDTRSSGNNKEDNDKMAKSDFSKALAKMNDKADDKADALAAAQSLLNNAGKFSTKKNLGPSSPLSPIAGDPGGANAANAALGSVAGGGGGGSVLGGGGGGGGIGGGGGGSGDDIFGAIGRGDEFYGGGAPGAGGGNFSFAKGVEFGSPNNAGDASAGGYAAVDGGDSGEDYSRSRSRTALQGQLLDLGLGGETNGKSWVMDRVGRFKKDMCDTPDEGKGIGVCERVASKRRVRDLERRLSLDAVVKKEEERPSLTAPRTNRDQNL